MPKVYVVNNKNLDLSPAKVYGEVVVLCDGAPNDIYMVSKHAHTLKRQLQDMNSSDYLAVAGHMLLCMLAFSIILEKFGFVNLLLFNVHDMSYTPRVVAKHQLKGGENAERS